ncbi:MAG: ABC transporter ATP-binding protein [Acidobacteriaceae bacterium]
MSEWAIETQRLSKHYASLRAVDELDIHVPKGSVYGFLGRNGAGKTTAIRLMMGLLRATGGTASVLGMDCLSQRTAIAARAGYVGERKMLLESMTGNDLVHFNRAYFAKWSDELANRYAQRMELPMDRKFKKLSLGNRTKLCLLLAMAQGAELLILDEPTSGLDPVVTDELLRLLIEDFANEGRTIFLSSHHLSEVERIADWVGIIEGGKLRLEAKLDDIRAEYRRIVASGQNLPATRNAQVLSAVANGANYEYVVTHNAEEFAAGLRNQGATIVAVTPLNLGEIFLQIVRKEDTCISGNAGATRA